jgi:myo-inositol-1(or 4)-monophosphatase
VSDPQPTVLPTDEELAHLEELAVALALEAGVMIRDTRPDAMGVHHTKTNELDVVTLMDTRCEALLRDRLASARPDDGVLGEEEGSTPGTSGLTWVLDPIDGTVNYLYDLPAYAVSVAVVVGDPTRPGQWQPLAGAVINPRTDEIFHARRGGGAHLLTAGGTAPLRVSEVAALDTALVATGFAYDRQVRHRQAAVLADLLPRVRDVRRMGAAALDLCHVGAGRVDGYYETGTQAWDHAAGWLVVTEAGGVVTGSGPGAAPSPELVVAAGPGVQELLRRQVTGGPVRGTENP